jgi:hypothetical protein
MSRQRGRGEEASVLQLEDKFTTENEERTNINKKESARRFT